jgi:DNA-directed RNA polymerase subunit H
MPHNPASHILQPKHSILKQKEVDELLGKYNISLGQLPKIKVTDPAIPDGANVGDIIKIERADEDGKHVYFRVVIV